MVRRDEILYEQSCSPETQGAAARCTQPGNPGSTSQRAMPPGALCRSAFHVRSPRRRVVRGCHVLIGTRRSSLIGSRAAFQNPPLDSTIVKLSESNLLPHTPIVSTNAQPPATITKACVGRPRYTCLCALLDQISATAELQYQAPQDKASSSQLTPGRHHGN